MKNRILAVMILGSVLFGNIAYADSPASNVKLADILAKSPLYLMVKIGPGAACDKNNKSSEWTDTGCVTEAVHYTGSIEAVEGTMTVATPINVGSNEVLASDSGDNGTPSTKISFDFRTNLTKKFIIKLFPNDTLTDKGKLMIKLGSESQEVSFAEIYNTGDFNFSMLDERRIKLIPLDSNLLKDRNLQFKNKLSVSSRLETMTNWAGTMLQEKKVTPELYNSFAELTEASWYKNYSDEDVSYFNWRYNRLKTAVNKGKLNPVFFYGGLNVLMKRFK